MPDKRAEMMAELLERTASLSPEEAKAQLDRLKNARSGDDAEEALYDESFSFGFDKAWGVINAAYDRELNMPCVLNMMLDPIVKVMEDHNYTLDEIQEQVSEAYEQALKQAADRKEKK